MALLVVGPSMLHKDADVVCDEWVLVLLEHVDDALEHVDDALEHMDDVVMP